MTTHDRVLRDGACAALELAARGGSVALEKAWSRFTPHRRALLPAGFIATLRREAASLASGRLTVPKQFGKSQLRRDAG